MNFRRKIFSKDQKKPMAATSDAPPDNPAEDPNMIRVFDKYGQEMFITREQWRDNVLMGNLKQAWNNPDALYGLIVQSLRDEFVEEVVPASEQLYMIDPIPSRAATVLGIVYMETGQLKKAEQVLSGYISNHGEEGVVLTNLAKVYSRQNLPKKSEQTLWRALEVDPNQDNGLEWYAATQRERGGKQAEIEALRKISWVPSSWRAQLWLAREELEKGYINGALGYYKQSLERAGIPTPANLLMQMSGDLGNNGFLKEIVEWVEPYFSASDHGLLVGNNLIKAFLDSGQLDPARRIIDQLYALKRPDWRETLSFWDTELAKARLKTETSPSEDASLQVTLLDIKGPLWLRDGSPFARLLPQNTPESPKIAIMGSVVTYKTTSEKAQSQLADNPGRLSRALPLILNEWLQIHTEAEAHALIAWAQEKGFAVFGKPYSGSDLCAIIENQHEQFDYAVGIEVDTTSTRWSIRIKFMKVAGAIPIAETEYYVDAEDPGAGVHKLLVSVQNIVVRKLGARQRQPESWYVIPEDIDGSNYLLRLEQLLAISCMNLEFLKGGDISGEREMLDGIIQLCARLPKNLTVRMLLTQTMRQMKKARPHIIPEFQEKLENLQSDFPLDGETGAIVSSTLKDLFSISGARVSSVIS
jgi:tetratricopeptide (TPR) repeat protein